MKKARRERPGAGRDRKELGRRGERFAAKHLTRKGYRVLARNLVVGRYETDLVVLDPDGRTVVLVEVKTRRGDALPPEVNVDHRKRRRLAVVAEMLRRRPRFANRPMRMDVVAIHWPGPDDQAPREVRHFVDAFGA